VEVRAMSPLTSVGSRDSGSKPAPSRGLVPTTRGSRPVRR
jgi:hypothetical protein